jgi:ribonucleoside-triphosphate reductase
MVSKVTAKPWELVDGNIKAEDDDSSDSSMECVGGSCPLK